MDILVTVIVLVTALVEIQGKNLDSGPQDLKDSVKLPPLSSQQRYATKEIILYLTPSQIKALQDGRGLISAQNNHYPDSNTQVQPYPQPLPAIQDNNEYLHRHLAHPQPLKVPPIEKPHSEDFNPITPPPEYRPSDNHAYINLKPQHQPHIPKSVPFFPEPHDQTILRGHELPTLNAHEPLHEKSQENHFVRDHLKEQWYRLLDQNRAHLKALAALSKHQIEKSNENKKQLLPYAPTFSQQHNALGIEQLISNNHQHQLEKPQALLQPEIIANAPPVFLQKEKSIKYPVHLIKQVKVPVPTPVLIPVPEPFEVQVPQPYPVPIEVIKPVPVPRVPLEVEKHIPVPVTKNLYINVDRPYFVDPREIPVLKSRLVPIHNHGRHY